MAFLLSFPCILHTSITTAIITRMTLFRDLTAHSSYSSEMQLVTPSAKSKGKLSMYRFPTTSSMSSISSKSSEGTVFDEDATLYEVEMDEAHSESSSPPQYVTFPPHLHIGHSADSIPPFRLSWSSHQGSPRLGDFVFDNDEDYEDYIEIVRAQTTSASPITDSVPTFYIEPVSVPMARKGKRTHLTSFEQQMETETSPEPEDPFEFSSFLSLSPSLSSSEQVEAVPSLTFSSSSSATLSTPAASGEQPPLIPMPGGIVETEDKEEGRRCNVSAEDLDERWQRSLEFAQWSKRGRSAVWESPEGASVGLQLLMASIEA